MYDVVYLLKQSWGILPLALSSVVAYSNLGTTPGSGTNAYLLAPDPSRAKRVTYYHFVTVFG
jgi:hypothetical protein